MGSATWGLLDSAYVHALHGNAVQHSCHVFISTKRKRASQADHSLAVNLWPEQGVPLALPVRFLVEQLVAGPKTGTNTGKASGTLARLPNLTNPD